MNLLSLLFKIYMVIGLFQVATCFDRRVIEVGCYVMNIGNVNLGGGTFEADFFLFMREIGSNSTTIPFTPRIVNGGRFKSVTIEGKEPDQSFLRITTSYYYRPDLVQYPFDTQALQILLEHPSKTKDEVLLVPMAIKNHPGIEETEEDFEYLEEYRDIGLSPQIRFPSYDLSSLSWEHSVTEGRYPHVNNPYSRYSFTVYLRRPKVRAFMKSMLPPMVILFVALFLVQLPESESVSRISGFGSSLVAAVMYHSNLDIQNNATGRFTLSDSLMVIIYSVLMMCIIVDVFLLKLKVKGKEDHLRLLGRTWAMVIWIMAPILLSFIFVEWYISLPLFMLGPIAIGVFRYKLLKAELKFAKTVPDEYKESLMWNLFPSIVFARHYSKYKKGEFDAYPLSEFETKKVEDGVKDDDPFSDGEPEPRSSVVEHFNADGMDEILKAQIRESLEACLHQSENSDVDNHKLISLQNSFQLQQEVDRVEREISKHPTSRFTSKGPTRGQSKIPSKMASRSESFQMSRNDPNLTPEKRPPPDPRQNLRKSISFLESIRKSLSMNPTPSGSRKQSIHYDPTSSENLITSYKEQQQEEQEEDEEFRHHDDE